jgi:hypothetical protein
VPLHDFEEWRDQQTAFESLAAFVAGTFNVRGTEGAERFEGAWMTANAFHVLRVRPCGVTMWRIHAPSLQ